MAPLPDRRWRRADGWIVRNLTLYGNSLVPRSTVKVLKRMFGEEQWKETAEAFHGVLDKMSDAEWTANRVALLKLRDALDTLIRNGVVTQACGTRKRISAAALRLGWEK